MQRPGQPPRLVAALLSGITCCLAAAGLGACAGPASPDCGIGGVQPQPGVGGEILYSCYSPPAIQGALYLLDISSGRVRRLTTDSSLNTDAEWSPDGRRIALQSTRDGTSALYLLDAGTGHVRWLTGGAGFNGLPRWSPDSAWISFNSSRDGISGPVGIAGFHSSVYVVRPDGTGVRRLTAGTGYNGEAVWSPDGNGLVFTSDRGGAFDLYLMAGDGRVERQLTHHEGGHGFASFASWAPDSTQLVFDASNPSGDRADSSLYVLTAAGGGGRRVTRGFDFRPDWSPDGTWIAFVGRRGAYTQLFTVRPDGSDLTQLTTDPNNKDWPRWRP